MCRFTSIHSSNLGLTKYDSVEILRTISQHPPARNAGSENKPYRHRDADGWTRRQIRQGVRENCNLLHCRAGHNYGRGDGWEPAGRPRARSLSAFAGVMMVRVVPGDWCGEARRGWWHYVAPGHRLLPPRVQAGSS
jgi:hypothetical protein